MFSRRAHPKCLHASLGRNLKIHLVFSPLAGRCIFYQGLDQKLTGVRGRVVTKALA
jgi:hypothetical protein